MREASDSNFSGRLTGVSLGPGSPDLITVRALEALKRADRIYYPVPARRGGGAEGSRCFSVLGHHGLADKAKPVPVDMKGGAAERSYGPAREAVLRDLKDGLDVAVACEGCVSLYSTVFRLLRGEVFGGNFELVPGVSSPSAAAAAAGVCLGLGSDRIAVVPGVAPDEEIKHAVENFETVVVMKPVRARPLVELVKGRGLDFVYCRDIGGGGHFITSSAADVEAGDFPYFSLFIISGRRPDGCPET